jgi:hypothetical protein
MTTPMPPAISSVSFDKAVYNIGDLITVTVSFSAGASDEVVTVTVTITDSVTGETASMTASLTVADPDASSVAVSDSGGRVWTQVSNSNNVAVFTATA